MTRSLIPSSIRRWIPAKLLDAVWELRMWWRLSPQVKNWFVCWLVRQSAYAGRLAREPVQVSLRHPERPMVTVRFRNGLRLTGFPESLAVIEHACRYESRYSFQDKLRAGNVVVDIGAHIGALGVTLASRGLQVYGFEPDPDNFALLMWNMQQNRLPSARCFQAAVSNVEGTVEFQSHTASMCGSLSKVHFGWGQSDTPRYTVPTTTLEKFLKEQELQRIDLLKIDCEGSEYDILFAPGARPVLQRCRYVLMEVHPVPEHSKEEMFRYLKESGFDFTVQEDPLTGCADLFATNQAFKDS